MAAILEKKRCETCGAVVLFDPKGEFGAMMDARARVVLESPPWGGIPAIPGSSYVGVEEPSGGVRMYVARRKYVEHVCAP